jgi:porin
MSIRGCSAWVLIVVALVVVATGPVLAREAAPESTAHKSGFTHEPDLGGPTSVPALLEEDDRLKDPICRFESIDRRMQPWFDLKSRIHDKIGLQFGLTYNMIYQALSESIDEEDNAFGGVFRVNGVWTLVNRDSENNGNLVFSFDHHHAINTTLAPSALAGSAGYIGQTTPFFSDGGVTLVDLNYQQRLGSGTGGFLAGRYDPNDYMDILGMVNPWTVFSNLASNLNPSIAFPDAGFGVAGGSWLGERLYALGGFNDANGNINEFEFYKGGAEFFKFAQVGIAGSRDTRFTRNLHVMTWHVDEREDAGIESGWGVTVAGNFTRADNRWMAFGRYGWSDGAAPIYGSSTSLGFLRKFRRNGDLLGFAANWGSPPDGALSDQTTLELFYRAQLAQNLALTPGLHWLLNPALNPDHDRVVVFSLRARYSI